MGSRFGGSTFSESNVLKSSVKNRILPSVTYVEFSHSDMRIFVLEENQFTTTNLKQEMRELKEAVTAQQTAMIQQNATIANIQEAVNSIHFILCSPSRYPKSDTKSPPFHIPETVASEHFHFAFASHELKPAKEVLVQDSSLENNSPVIMSTSNDQVCLFSAFLLKTRRCPVDVSAYTYTRTLTPSRIHSHIYTRTHTCIH